MQGNCQNRTQGQAMSGVNKILLEIAKPHIWVLRDEGDGTSAFHCVVCDGVGSNWSNELQTFEQGHLNSCGVAEVLS